MQAETSHQVGVRGARAKVAYERRRAIATVTSFHVRITLPRRHRWRLSQRSVKALSTRRENVNCRTRQAPITALTGASLTCDSALDPPKDGHCELSNMYSENVYFNAREYLPVRNQEVVFYVAGVAQTIYGEFTGQCFVALPCGAVYAIEVVEWWRRAEARAAVA